MSGDASEMILPLAAETWGPEELAAIERVTASRRFTMGPEVAAFEAQAAEYFGCRYCVMANSGSSANLLGVAGLFHHPDIALAPGDNVIVPAVSWSTTYAPWAQHGVTLRFVDIDPETLNIDVDQVEAAIDARTRGIFAVNLLGNPCDLPRLQALAQARGIFLAEDNCESMGARIAGRFTGAFGAFGTLSTFFSHHISTMEGGLVLTDDRKLRDCMISLRAHGWVRGLEPDSHLNIDATPFEKSFRFVLPGYNLRPLEMSGAIGQAQLAKLPGFVAARRANAETYKRLFAEHEHVRIQRETGESSWFGFAFVLRGALKGRRGDVVAALGAAGVETRPIVTGDFTRNPVIRLMAHETPVPLTAAPEIDLEGLFVGNHHFDAAAGLERVAEVIDRLAAR